jgi:UDP-glucose 4-epimerase
MGKRILVTGGAGFVGSCLCRELKEDSYHVTAVDDLSNGKRENIPEGVDFIRLDISSGEGLKRLDAHSFDSVIHCAAQSSNALSFKDPKQDMLTNQLGTLNVLNYCMGKKINRFIFTSSMSVYGQPEHLPTKETDTPYPDSFYAIHKLGSEHYIRIFARQYGIQYTIFRLFTTYGFGQNLENVDQGLLSIYLSHILNERTLVVKGSKDRTRDIIHVSDVVNAIKFSLDNPKSYNRVYNLGTGQSMKIEKIVEMLTTGLGYRRGEYPVRYESGTEGDPFDTLADIEEAKRDLGWKPRISAEEGIRLTLENYKALLNRHE